MTDDTLEYDKAIAQGLTDYEGNYQDYVLKAMLEELEKLYLFRERLNKLIYLMKQDLIDSYKEKVAE